MGDEVTSIEANRTRIQQLYARGLIDLFEYETLGRHHGFVSRTKTTGASLRTVAGIVGLAFVVVSAVAEVIAQSHPEMRGPLETLVQIVDLVGQSL